MTQQIFIAVVDDRHCDIEIQPFTDRESAIVWAKAKALMNARNPKDCIEKETDDSYRVDYSEEGDYVVVEEATLL